MTGTPFPERRDTESVRAWLRENKRSAEERGPVPATAREFAERHMGRLLRETASEGAPPPVQRLDLALTGPATDQHVMRISVLGGFLSEFQDSLHAVAQALTGRPTAAASVPGWIKEQTALRAAAVFPSSFGLTLYGPGAVREGPRQESLLPDGEMLDEAVGLLLKLALLAEDEAAGDDALADELLGLGQRALKHLASLTSRLADEGIGLRLQWWESGGRSQRALWSTRGMQRVRELCEESRFEEPETETLVGRVTAADTGRRSLTLARGGEPQIRATVQDDLVKELRKYFDREARVTFEVTRGLSRGRTRETYVVTHLDPA